MSTYVIGDIQGCFEPLTRLLTAIDFDTGEDQIWLVGDLVNRGPASLEVLRWAYAHRNSLRCVLGNHDLHLLACALADRPLRPDDTLAPLLAAPDRDTLVQWLRERPLAHLEDSWLLVHAGIHPRWSTDEALERAGEVEAVLRSPEGPALLMAYRAMASRTWSPGLRGVERLATITSIFTRIRCLDPAQRLDFDYTGSLPGRPEGLQPWWFQREPSEADPTLLFGHWAALGIYRGPGVIGLDSGCVWGRSLSALRLEDQRLFEVAAVAGP